VRVRTQDLPDRDPSVVMGPGQALCAFRDDKGEGMALSAALPVEKLLHLRHKLFA
jgi:hypothetical protein